METDRSVEPCLEMLKEKELEPPCAEFPGYPSCQELLDLNPEAHRLCAEARQPLFPFVALACVKRVDGKVVDSRYFPPKEMAEECKKLARQGEDWELSECFCCCGGGGSDSVETAEGARQMRAVGPGDSVLAGFLARPGGAIEWRPLPVALSETTPASAGAVRLALGERQVVCPRERLLLGDDGRLVAAGELRAGSRLRAADGLAVEVTAVGAEETAAPVQRIAVEAPRRCADGAPALDGHLLALDGLIAGDFTLEVLLGAAAPTDAAAVRDGDRLPVA